MKAVLVTGGAGYVGSHACKALVSAGYEPVCYDNLVTGHREAVRWGPFEYGDVLDRARLGDVIRRHRPASVMHFAGFAYVGESVEDPDRYYRNNVMGTLTLLEAMRGHGVRRIIFSSSCAVYGQPESVPIGEQVPARPVNPYGTSKLFVETMLRDFEAAYGLEWIALRYFNAAGDDPDGEIGEDHEPETRLVPAALAAASGRSGPLTVYGTDYDTPDGTCIRDYVHVSDLAAAHLLGLKALDDGLPSQVLNLGTGRGRSVREILRAVELVTGRRPPVVFGPRRKGDPAILVADASRARGLLRWEPRLTAIEDIVATAWNWHARKTHTDRECRRA